MTLFTYRYRGAARSFLSTLVQLGLTMSVETNGRSWPYAKTSRIENILTFILRFIRQRADLHPRNSRNPRLFSLFSIRQSANRVESRCGAVRLG
jgi:hypothetical protein